MHGSLPGLAAGRFGVIMFFSACRLPSFAPEDPPSHASGNQITTGILNKLWSERERPKRAWRAGPSDAKGVDKRWQVRQRPVFRPFYSCSL